MTGDPIQEMFVRFGMDTADFEAGVKQATSTAAEFEARVKELVDGGKTLNEAMQMVEPPVVKVAEALQQTTPAAQQAAGAIADTGKAAVEAADQTGSLTKQLLQMAGIAISLNGLKNAIVETFSAFAEVQRSTEALTALTGSASTAANMIDRLRIVAQTDALSFSSLLTAQQRMIAFGLSSQETAALLESAANAARATNTDFDRVANAIERMAASGMAGGRQLASLGLTSKDLGDAMGVAAESASKLFKSLDEEARVSVINEALSKFKDLAASTANDLAGQWQQLKNTAEFTFAEIGAALAPLGAEFLRSASDDVKAIGSIIKELIDLGKTFSDQSLVGIAAMSALAVGTGTSALLAGGYLIQLGLAHRQLADAQDEADRAGKQATDGLAKMSITAHQAFAEYPDFLAKLKALDDAQNHGQSTWQEYVKGIQNLNTEFFKLHPNLVATTAGHETFASAVKKLVTDLNSGAISQDQYNTKLQALVQKYSSAGDAAGDAAKATKEFIDEENRMAQPFGSAASSRFSPETVALVGEYTAAMKQNKTAVDNVSLAYANMAGSADNSAASLNKVLRAWQAFMAGGWDQLQDKLSIAMTKIGQQDVKLPSVTLKWDAITQGFDEIQNKAKGVTGETQKMIAGFMESNEKGIPPLDALKEALKGLGLTLDNVTGEATTKTLQFWHTVAGQGTLDEVEAGWAKVSGAITKLAKTDLPLAATEQQKYLDALIRTGASGNQITEAWIAGEQTKIQAAKMAGQEISADEEAQLMQAKRRLADSLMSTEDAFKNLGLTGGATYRDLAQQAVDSYDKIKASGKATTLDLLNGWINMTQKQIAAAGDLGRIYVQFTNSVAKGFADDLIQHKSLTQSLNEQATAAKTAYDNILKSSTAAVDSQSQVQAAYDEMQRKQALYDNLGATASSALRAEYKRLADAAKTNYDTIKQAALDQVPAQQQVIDAYNKMMAAQDQATNPSIWLKFKDTLTKAFQDIAKVILEDFIKVALTALGKALTGLQGQAGALGTVLGGLGKVLTGGKGGGIPGLGGGSPVDSSGQTPADWGWGGASSAASSAAGSAEGSAGGLLGGADPLSQGLFGLAQTIYGFAQQAHQNNILGQIEESTRYMKSFLGDNIVKDLQTFLPRIAEMRDFFLNWAQGVWWDIHEYSRDTRDHLLGGGVISSATSSIGVFNAPGDAGIRLSIDSINALADAMIARSAGGSGSSGDSTSPAVVDATTQAMFRRFKQRGLATTRA